MAIFRISGVVTVSAYTEVEALDLAEAKKIAADRQIALGGHGYDVDEFWIIDDVDGVIDPKGDEK